MKWSTDYNCFSCTLFEYMKYFHGLDSCFLQTCNFDLVPSVPFPFALLVSLELWRWLLDTCISKIKQEVLRAGLLFPYESCLWVRLSRLSHFCWGTDLDLLFCRTLLLLHGIVKVMMNWSNGKKWIHSCRH